VECGKISVAGWSGICKIRPSPSKPRASVFHAKNVGEESGVAAVSIWKRMDFRHKLIVKANGDFLDTESLVLYPEIYIFLAGLVFAGRF